MQLLEVDTLSKRKKNVKICIKNIIIVSTHIQYRHTRIHNFTQTTLKYINMMENIRIFNNNNDDDKRNI